MFGRRKSKPRRGTIAEVVSRSLEIPADVAGGLAQVELLGNREAAIEHCQNVLEYNDDVIRLNTGKLIGSRSRDFSRPLSFRSREKTV